MTRHLIAIQIGPVQTFIAAARKTRDLWCGSQLLSRISSDVARAVASECGGNESVIFPALGKLPAPDDDEQVARFSNVILAVVPDGKDAAVVFKAAKKVGCSSWRAFAIDAKQVVGDNRVVNDTIWNQQIDNVIEFYGAWEPLSEKIRYSTARENLMRRLAGRKALRDFGPYAGAALPKSSLGSGYESVINPGTNGLVDERVSRWLKLNSGEHLDCAGLTKRLAFAKKRIEPDFPSVARIAAESWVKTVSEHPNGPDCLDQLKTLCETPILQRLIHKVKGFEAFPYEGTILYNQRHREFLEELGDKSADKVKEALFEATTKVKEICRPFKSPSPYLAILRADGDSIGAFLKDLCLRPSSASADTMIKRHQKFSGILVSIANKAKTIVTKHGGSLIYSGGDDFLAFMPVKNCLESAKELRQMFCESLKDAKFESVLAHELPTISVGVAVGHFMEPMEWLLEWAAEALQTAKSGIQPAEESTTTKETCPKNGLAIHVHKRGGTPIKCRGRWEWTGKTEADKNLEERLRIWIEGWDHQTLSGKIPAELHRMAQEHENMMSAAANPTDEVRELCVNSTRGAAQRMVSRTRPSGGNAETSPSDAIKLLNTSIANFSSEQDLRNLAHELKTARELAASIKLVENNEVGQ